MSKLKVQEAPENAGRLGARDYTPAHKLGVTISGLTALVLAPAVEKVGRPEVEGLYGHAAEVRALGPDGSCARDGSSCRRDGRLKAFGTLNHLGRSRSRCSSESRAKGRRRRFLKGFIGSGKVREAQAEVLRAVCTREVMAPE